MPEPELDAGIYEEILDILSSFLRGFERTPKTAVKFDEEELRDQALIQLNGHLVGEAGGELFNGAGKTDILIRHEDRNVFIAECKIWSGAKALHAALDQLASYMVWRDTKAALIVFIRQKDASAIIEKAQAAVEAHPSFKRRGPESAHPDQYTRFVVQHADDDQREIHLALMYAVIRPSD